MRIVSGIMKFLVGAETTEKNDDMAKLQVNYIWHPEMAVAYKLIAIDGNGKEHVAAYCEVISEDGLETIED